MAGLKLRDRAHGLGFGGHFLTKSRRYSTTMGALRAVRGITFAGNCSRERLVLDAWVVPKRTPWWRW